MICTRLDIVFIYRRQKVGD